MDDLSGAAMLLKKRFYILEVKVVLGPGFPILFMKEVVTSLRQHCHRDHTFSFVSYEVFKKLQVLVRDTYKL